MEVEAEAEVGLAGALIGARLDGMGEEGSGREEEGETFAFILVLCSLVLIATLSRGVEGAPIVLLFM